MVIRKLIGIAMTASVFVVAVLIGRALWVRYMDEPWTRDGRVRADIIGIAPDVSGAVVSMPVADNQLVHKGDLLMEVDPSHYAIAVEQAKATVDAHRADFVRLKADADRRQDMDNDVVSKESRDNALKAAASAAALLRQAQAQLDAAELNLSRTKVYAPVDGYVTNLNVHRGDYVTTGVPKLAVIDSASFWVFGYFEETKLPHVKIGDKAHVRLMSGGEVVGHVDSISRGIYDRDNPVSKDLTADVNPTFNWVRLAQRVPVRIHIDSIARDVILSAGTTCTVTIDTGDNRRGTGRIAALFKPPAS
ncbi:efflux RND transporter periplasmic adaptor subunit [Paraburkholderia strydomiana]|uniref:efflux RND transporter periplasmic adaptor subunit n=1 Tax=Paraburkholderia strydomiana TaxID=1245417 RepID=UPI0038B7642F